MSSPSSPEKAPSGPGPQHQDQPKNPQTPPSGSGPVPSTGAPSGARAANQNVGPKKASPASANEAARSVADAVSRVAAAAVAEIQRHGVEEDEDHDFIFTGVPGGRFKIDGPVKTFSTNGTVTLNGQQLHAFAWSSGRIEGNLPEDAKPGVVTVAIDDKTKFTGKFKG